MKSPIKWVGSKKWCARDIAPLIREHLKGTYFEPFAGGAAVFFHLKPRRAVLSDTIYPLISLYQHLQTNYQELRDHLHVLAHDTNNAVMYEAARSRFNTKLSDHTYDAETAALFFYLNRLGFNGLWRQNKDGEYNVPFGQHDSFRMPTMSELMDLSRILSHAQLIHIVEPINVLDVIRQAKSGDVVFADPPYYKTYNGYDGLHLPSEEFQQKIAIELWQANIRGATIIAMNNDTPETQRWYGAFCKVDTICRKQNIAGNIKDRKQWNQILAIAT